MKMNVQQELAGIIARYSKQEGINETCIPGVSLFKSSAMDAPLPSIYSPCLLVLAQGRKQVVLNQEIYCYGPAQYLAVSVNLPVLNQITEASKTAPYLLMQIDLRLPLISELLLHTGRSATSTAKTDRGLFVGHVDEKMGDGILRLARLLDFPEDIPVLAVQTMREIFYRVLCGPYGSRVSQIALRGSHMDRIAGIIRKIKESVHEAIIVEDLAHAAGMSVSSFHAHFKAVTAMSPLQFQKHLRLIEARNLMLGRDMDAASAGYQVGYESSSQFNREYARMFGSPPGRDISLLRR